MLSDGIANELFYKCIAQFACKSHFDNDINSDKHVPFGASCQLEER